jgi:hypothetical protein
MLNTNALPKYLTILVSVTLATRSHFIPSNGVIPCARGGVRWLGRVTLV